MYDEEERLKGGRATSQRWSDGVMEWRCWDGGESDYVGCCESVCDCVCLCVFCRKSPR